MDTTVLGVDGKLHNHKYALYQIGHIADLSSILALHFVKNYNDGLIPIVLSIGIDPTMRKLINELFEKVLICNATFGLRTVNKNEIENEIINYFDNEFKRNSISLQEVKHIYCFSDITNQFAIYLSLKEKNYIACESFPNYLFNFNRYKTKYKVKSASLAFYETQLEHKALSGDGIYCEKALVFPGTTNVPEGLQVEVFDFHSNFYLIPGQIKKTIINILDIRIDTLDPINILFDQSDGMVTNSLTITSDKTYLIYQLMLDYYFYNSKLIYLKRHPYCNNNMPLEKYLNNINSLNRNIPIEYYFLQNNFIVNDVISIFSSANSKIETKIKGNNIQIGNNYFRFYMLLHKLYLAFSFIIFLQPKDKSLFKCNFINDQLESFLSFSEFKDSKFVFKNCSCKDFQENSITLVQKTNEDESDAIVENLSEASPNAIVIFLNLENKICCLNRDLLQYIYPIVIKKTKIKELVVENLANETVYVFCKSSNFINKIAGFCIEKDLCYTGIHLSCKPLAETETWLKRVELLYDEVWKNADLNLLENPNFSEWDNTSTRIVLFDSFRKVCSGWNAICAHEGEFYITKLQQGIEICISKVSKWHVLEQVIPSSTVQLLKDKTLVFTVKVNSPTNIIKGLHCYGFMDGVRYYFAKYAYKGATKGTISVAFEVPNNLDEGKPLVVGIDLSEIKDSKVSICSMHLEIENTPQNLSASPLNRVQLIERISRAKDIFKC